MYAAPHSTIKSILLCADGRLVAYNNPLFEEKESEMTILNDETPLQKWLQPISVPSEPKMKVPSSDVSGVDASFFDALRSNPFSPSISVPPAFALADKKV